MSNVAPSAKHFSEAGLGRREGLVPVNGSSHFPSWIKRSSHELYHPSLGSGLSIGRKTLDAFEIKTQILRSLSKDVRFEDVNAKVQVDGGAVLVSLTVRIKNTDQQIPLQFAVTV